MDVHICDLKLRVNVVLKLGLLVWISPTLTKPDRIVGSGSYDTVWLRESRSAPPKGCMGVCEYLSLEASSCKEAAWPELKRYCIIFVAFSMVVIITWFTNMSA